MLQDIRHILIDATTVSRRMDGLSQFILNVVSRLPQHADRRYTVVVRPDECAAEYTEAWQAMGMEVCTAPIAPIGPLRELQFRRWLRTRPPFDAAFIPSNQYPVALSVPSVYVVHDLIYERYPEQLGRLAAAKRRWLHRNVAAGLQQASRVVAVSRFTQSEIVRFHPQADSSKFQVVYEGWEHLQSPHTGRAVIIPFREYVLYTGSSRGHKNIQGLLDAVEAARTQLPAGTGIVIAGDDSMLSPGQRQQAAALKEHVLFTGWLGKTQLDSCYRQARAVIFPSLCEGFGIPVLEAFYYRKPLLASNSSSLPEVAGDAAIYFDPMQPAQIAAALLRALTMTESEQTEWIARGQARLKTFSWQKTADEIDRIITSICKL